MARPKPWEISDELWVIELRFPRHERQFPYPGRRRVDDRKTSQGIVFVLCRWEFSPQEPGFGSGSTC